MNGDFFSTVPAMRVERRYPFRRRFKERKGAI